MKFPKLRTVRADAAARRALTVVVSLVCACLIAACSSIQYPVNVPLPHVDEAGGYRLQRVASRVGDDGLLVILAFSGGGTRAAALSYGVLEELAHTEIVWKGRQRRLLDQVDLVYAVSGGSITAAYWALAGDRIFDDFVPGFLERDIQSQLVKAVESFPNLWRLGSNRFGRGELLESTLDINLFHGATFADLARRTDTPYVVISATDLSSGARFDFTQDYFDLLCSDLGRLPLARAVAASSAVPLLFAPITLWNYAGECGYVPPRLIVDALADSAPRRLGETRTQQRAREMASYLELGQKPFVHLVDGGVADNLAVRGLLEAEGFTQHGERSPESLPAMHVSKVVFVMVDAGIEASSSIDQSPDVPRVSAVTAALASIPIQRYSNETRQLLQAAFERWRTRGMLQDTQGQAPDLYVVEASLRALPGDAQRRRLTSIPTTLFLPASDVDALRGAAHELLRASPDFQRLKRDLGAPSRVNP